MKYENFDINLFQYQNNNIELLPKKIIKKNHSNKNIIYQNQIIDNFNNFFSNRKNKMPLNNNYSTYNNIPINNDIYNNQQLYAFSSRENNFYNNKNNIYNSDGFNYINKNKSRKGLYKTPQSRSCENISYNIIEKIFVILPLYINLLFVNNLS